MEEPGGAETIRFGRLQLGSRYWSELFGRALRVFVSVGAFMGFSALVVGELLLDAAWHNGAYFGIGAFFGLLVALDAPPTVRVLTDLPSADPPELMDHLYRMGTGVRTHGGI